MRKLPPLHALNCFEVTAKVGTVREAASLLCISPSAVSHQIAKLEAYLQSPLFHRVNKRLQLTDTGYNYLQQIERALTYIEEATWDSLNRKPSEQLTISVPPSFSSLWLLPKLRSFSPDNQDINICLKDHLTMDKCLDSVDCGIEYRFSAAKDRFSKVLFEDEVMVLANPEYVSNHKIGKINDLEGKCLILTERRFHSWRAILKEHNWLEKCQIISVRYTYQALNAAIAGLGIALGNRQNAEHFISQKLLVSPFEIDIPDHKSPKYYFSCQTDALQHPKVSGFYHWLKSNL